MEFLKAGGDIMKPEEIKQASPNATPSKRQAASVSPARKAQKKEQFLSFEPNQGKKNTRRNQFGFGASVTRGLRDKTWKKDA